MVTRFIAGLALACMAAAPALAEDFNPPMHKHGVGCSTAADVHKFVDFIKTIPGETPTVVALIQAELLGIKCSSGEADIVKEEVVDHFTWIDGSKMLMLHFTFVNGKDVYTWRADTGVQSSSCDTNEKGCI